MPEASACFETRCNDMGELRGHSPHQMHRRLSPPSARQRVPVLCLRLRGQTALLQGRITAAAAAASSMPACVRCGGPCMPFLPRCSFGQGAAFFVCGVSHVKITAFCFCVCLPPPQRMMNPLEPNIFLCKLTGHRRKKLCELNSQVTASFFEFV